jgi:hypothetical protein
LTHVQSSMASELRAAVHGGGGNCEPESGCGTTFFLGRTHRYITSRFKMSIAADVHPWGEISLLTAPPTNHQWCKIILGALIIPPYSFLISSSLSLTYLSISLPILACQSKMQNFSSRGLHVQTMPVHSPCTVYKDDVTLNLGR